MHYAGHDHQYYTQSTGGFTSYIAPYLHKKETSVSGVYHPTGFLALLVSPTQGVMETKVVHYDSDYVEVTGCWADGSVCGARSSCKYCCHSNRNAIGTQCGGAKWPDGTLCGDGTTCDYCENDFEYWDQLSFTACGGSAPCWSRGSHCGAGTTCNNCCGRYSWWWSLFFTACD